MKLGIERLLESPSMRAPLRGRRVALLAHPASVTRDLTHSLDALAALPDITLSAAFGPQHGLRGDKQDNMVESIDYVDPRHGIPVFSLYGEVRRPTDTMMARTAAPATALRPVLSIIVRTVGAFPFGSLVRLVAPDGSDQPWQSPSVHQI